MPVRLLAISDLHIGVASNRAALDELPDHHDDWLLVAGDVGEKVEHIEHAMRILTAKFAKVFWTPGNHELWSTNDGRGVAKYDACVAACRRFGVVTPEDPYVRWPDSDFIIAPIFTLFDYSFKPDDVAIADAVDWAAATNVVSADEMYLKSEPFATRADWCASRCRITEERLIEASAQGRLILMGHFPLVKDIVRLRFIERFVIWCGTTLTRDWHTRFNVDTVVYGHLHVRSTEWRDGVRFEESSLGMTRQWHRERGIEGYLREILPGPPRPSSPDVAPVYRP